MTEHSRNTHPEYFRVKLFRTYQALYDLVKDERLALLRYDYQWLKSLAENRTICFDTIERLEYGRNLWLPGSVPTVQLIRFQEESADGKQAQLQRGIETLFNVIQEWTDGNQGIARSALMRIEAAKTMLNQQNKTLNARDPAWQTPGLASIRLFLGTQETILQGVLEGNIRLEKIKKSFFCGSRGGANLKIDVSSPLTGF